MSHSNRPKTSSAARIEPSFTPRRPDKTSAASAFRGRLNLDLPTKLTLLALCVVAALFVQQNVIGQARELIAHLASPPLEVHELPASAGDCDAQGRVSPSTAGPAAPAEPVAGPIAEKGVEAVATRLLREAEQEISELGQRIGALEGELRHAEAVTFQLRDQLQRERQARGKARLEGAGGRDARQSRAAFDPVAEIEKRLKDLGFEAAPATSSGSFERSFVVAQPKVQFLGSDAWITGTVTNRTERELQPLLVIELLRNDRVEGRRELRLPVSAGATAPYEARLPTQLAEGTYSARVRVEA